MKVIYIDLQYSYGVKERGLNTYGQLGILKTFKKLGHDVLEFYYDDYLDNVDKLQKDLKDFADRHQPELLFFCLFTEQFKTETLDYLKGKYKTAAWFLDDSWRFDIYTKYYAKHFTYCFTLDEFSIAKYHKFGQKNVYILIGGPIDDESVVTNPAKKENYRYDVSFIGSHHPYREWFLRELEKRGFKVSIFGYGWDAGLLPIEEMIDVLRSSKINLNISNSLSFDFRYLMSKKILPGRLQRGLLILKLLFRKDPQQMLKPFIEDKSNSQIKWRNFEIAYHKGFQLTDYVPTIEKYYDIGKEIACYGNVDEAAMLIDYYLKKDSLREEMIENAYKKTAEKYTLYNQMKGMFNIVNQ